MALLTFVRRLIRPGQDWPLDDLLPEGADAVSPRVVASYVRRLHSAVLDLADCGETADVELVEISHYPHPLYDGAGFEIAGDFESHRNVPNGEGRSVEIERLYVINRT